MSILAVLVYLPQHETCLLQAISRDFYHVVIPKLFRNLSLDTYKPREALVVFRRATSYYVLSAATGLEWVEKPYVMLSRTGQYWPDQRYPGMWPKIVRASKCHAYFLGGNDELGGAVKRCFRLNLADSFL